MYKLGSCVSVSVCVVEFWLYIYIYVIYAAWKRDSLLLFPSCYGTRNQDALTKIIVERIFQSVWAGAGGEAGAGAGTGEGVVLPIVVAA